MTPQIHATLLLGSSVLSLVLSVAILASSPKSTSARMHAVYGGLVAWWFFSMAILAEASAPDEIERWSRLVHLAIGMLPAVVFHLNVAAAGLSREHRRAITVHYGLAGALTVFYLFSPSLFGPPTTYPWGAYPTYTAWGILPLGFLLVSLSEVWMMYRRALRRAVPGSAYWRKAHALSRGNLIAALAVVDFLPVFGFEVYPPGFAIMAAMLGATLYGTIRYKLIEITPEFAAEKILHLLPDGVFVVDSKGSVRLANEGAARILGRDLPSLIGHALTDVAPQPLSAASSAIEDGSADQEIVIDSADGESFVVKLSGALLRDQTGKSVGRLCVLHDITAQRQAEAKKDELEGWVRHSQKLETLGVMAGGVAHDFNNLLAVILGNAEIAGLEVQDGRSAEEELRAIAIAAKRGSELTRQMLRFAGEGTTTMAPVDLNAVCTETLDLFRSAISKKANLSIDLADELPLVMGDRGNIHQVILNLVTNASDALGENVGTITLSTALLEAPASGPEQEPQVILEVRDTGCGMDAETKDRIFDPFFTTKFTGRGLGLANVMGIVLAHGGRIRVETEPGNGTCFTVALPAAPVQTVQPARSGVHTALDEGRGVALVVDDEPAVRRVVRWVLAKAGFEVVEAENGQEGLEVYEARQEEILVVLLDMTMPELDGRETLARIRTLSAEVPVILMSGYTETEPGDLAPGRPPLFLAKPFTTEVLTQRLQEATSGGFLQ